MNADLRKAIVAHTAHCIQCPMREPVCRGGCPCRVDGVDFTAHLSAIYCPHPNGPRFGNGHKPAGWDDKPKADVLTPARLAEIDKLAQRHREKLKAEGGRRAWAKLHTEGVGQDAAWLAEWEKLIPCGECREKYLALKAAVPPEFPLQFEWGWTIHDAVNADLPGKERPTLESARVRWATAGVRRS